jgi:hypothetical protein
LNHVATPGYRLRVDVLMRVGIENVYNARRGSCPAPTAEAIERAKSAARSIFRPYALWPEPERDALWDSIVRAVATALAEECRDG